jgi:hypothetical protein
MVAWKIGKTGNARFWAEHIDNGLLCQCRFCIGLRGEAAQASVDQSFLSSPVLHPAAVRVDGLSSFLISEISHKTERSSLKVTINATCSNSRTHRDGFLEG